MPSTTGPTSTTPAAIGPYSPGRWAGSFLFLSGRLGVDPASGELKGPGLREQAAQAMANLEAGLREAGLDWSHLVKTTVFLTNMADFAEFNQIYAAFFAGCTALPARSCVQVAALPRGGCVEIEGVAFRQD
jgi:2-iminobutanoate/2-iminopropanoate deaminase